MRRLRRRRNRGGGRRTGWWLSGAALAAIALAGYLGWAGWRPPAGLAVPWPGAGAAGRGPAAAGAAAAPDPGAPVQPAPQAAAEAAPQAEAQPAPEAATEAAPQAAPDAVTEAAPAPVRVTVAPYAIGQGELAVVRVQDAPGPASGEMEGLPPLAFFARGGQQVALLAVPAGWEPGARTLTVRWDGGQWQEPIEIQPRPFPEDRITVSKQQEALSEDPRVAEQAARVRRLRSQGMPEPAWSGRFIVPVEGRLTTAFGEIRYINDRRSGQHSGMDLAAPAGTPVVAANRGKVVLADDLVLTGLTVIIDHGGGLFTGYAHMSALSVAAGDWVSRGREIGKVGSTGRSTGPHLHWTATVGNTYFDPLFLAGREPLARPLPTGHQP